MCALVAPSRLVRHWLPLHLHLQTPPGGALPRRPARHDTLTQIKKRRGGKRLRKMKER